MTTKDYLLSLPERILRSVLGVGAGVTRELGEIALPAGIRRSRLYQNLVDATLRYVIERVGGVDGVYDAEERLPDNFLARRAAGKPSRPAPLHPSLDCGIRHHLFAQKYTPLRIRLFLLRLCAAMGRSLSSLMRIP